MLPETVVEGGGGAEEEVVVVVVVVVGVELVLEEMTPPVPLVVPPEFEHLFQVVTTQSLELALELELEVVELDTVVVPPLTLIKQSDPDAPALLHAAESPIIIRYSAASETLVSPTRK